MCSVNNCHYWGKGNRCEANQIFVTSDKLGASALDSFDATQAVNAAATPANDCMETACKTFVPQGSNQANVDSILKL